jgi:hypothetical protein
VVCATGFEKPALYQSGSTVWLSTPDHRAQPVDRVTRDLRLSLGPHERTERIWAIGATAHLRIPIINYLDASAHQAHEVVSQLARGAARTAQTPKEQR